MENIFEYKNKEWQIVEDESVTCADHCTYCEFIENCEKYTEEMGWFACGCTFHPMSIYIIEVKNNVIKNEDN